MIRPTVRVRSPFQITHGQNMTELTARNHEVSLISPITEAEGA